MTRRCFRFWPSGAEWGKYFFHMHKSNSTLSYFQLSKRLFNKKIEGRQVLHTQRPLVAINPYRLPLVKYQRIVFRE